MKIIKKCSQCGTDLEQPFMNPAIQNNRAVLLAWADGFVPETGQGFFRGTEFVRGDGYGNGVDTIPAWLTKGERVLTADQNKQLGGISHEQLVGQIRAIEPLGIDLSRGRSRTFAPGALAVPPRRYRLRAGLIGRPWWRRCSKSRRRFPH